MKTRRALIIVVSVAILTLAIGGAWWRHADQQRDAVARLLPPRPELSGVAIVLQEKIAGADANARSLLRPAQGLVELSRLYHANGFLEEAVQCYVALEQLAPDEPRWPHRHATILAGYGDIEPAIALWRRVVERSPDYLPARIRIGDALLKANRFDEASAAYAEVLKRKPGEPYATFGLARLDYEAGRFDQARQRLEAIVAQTNYELGYDLIVSLYERIGLHDRAAAIRGANKASGAYRDPPDPWVDELMDACFDPYRLSLAAGVAARIRQPETAVRLLERALQLAPEDVSAHFQLGHLYGELGKIDLARQQYERCTILAPDFADGWAWLSQTLAQQGDHSGAERTLAAGLQRCPDSPGLHLMHARNLRKARRLGEAIGEFRTSIRLRPNEPEAYIELGHTLIELDRVDEGVAQLRAALEVEPGNPMALSVLAFHAISTGDEREARRWLGRVHDQPRVPREQVNRLHAAFRQQFGRSP